MANKDEPRGFSPYGRILATHEYVGGATAIYQGDLCQLNSIGKVAPAAAGNTQLVGVCVSYRPTTKTTVLLYDDPDQQFLVQDDASGSTVLVQTHINNNIDILA